MLHNEIGKCVLDWPPPFSRPSHFRKICVPFIHQSSPFNKQISYAKREKEKGNILGSSSNTETYLLPFGRLYSPLNKRWRKKPIFYQNKIIIISRFDWVPCRITAPEWKKLSKSEHNLFDFYHFCCLTRFFSFLFQAFPISMLFSIYIGAQTSRTFSLHIFFCVRDLCRPVEKFIVCFRTQHAKQWQKSHAFYLAFKCECEAKKVFGKWWFPFSTTCNVLPGNHSTFFFSPFPLFILCVRRRNSPLKLSLLFNRFVHWFNGPFGDIVSDANHFIRSIFSVVCLFRS